MNVSTITPEQAWQMTLDQLRLEMPKADFDTWVGSAHFVAFGDGVLIVGIPNAYGRDWLASRLTGTVNRLLTGILDQPVEVQFTVMEEMPERKGEVSLLYEETPVPEQHPKVLSLQAEYQSVYDEIVHPDQVIVVPGYFLRYIPLLGPDLAWLYVGFRQAAYEAGASRKPSKKFGAPAKKVARFSGMSLRTFRRWSARPDTWQRLQGLVTLIDDKRQWLPGSDGHPHRVPCHYQVAMTLPLTPSDERSLRGWLYRELAQGKAPRTVLQAALETSPDDLIPWQENEFSSKETGVELHSVEDVLHAVCGPITEGDRKPFQELANQLTQHLMPPRDLIILTHYFVTRWLPKLGYGPGWLVVLLRDRGYINPRTGEIRDELFLPDGYAEAASRLGIKRVKTIWDWLRNDTVARFVREIGHETGAWEESPRFFKVCMGEPMTDDDRFRANEILARRGIGGLDTIRSESNGYSIGAVDTISGEIGTIRHDPIGHPVGAIDTISGAVDTIRHDPDGAVDTISGANDTISNAASDHSIGADGTHIGAVDIHIGANGTTFGAVDTIRRGAIGTFDWREWHSLNTLILGLKHLENTLTTTHANSQNGIEQSSNTKEVTQEVVGSKWDLNGLLNHNRVSAKNQEVLLNNGLTAQAFLSWLLYAASPGGNGIRDPIGHAVSRLIQDPSRGAGGMYDQLARLPASELAELLTRELDGGGFRDPTWQKVMDSSPRSRLRLLADQLGISVPKVNDW